jgi:TolC family type I secretion outer membrane protein
VTSSKENSMYLSNRYKHISRISFMVLPVLALLSFSAMAQEYSTPPVEPSAPATSHDEPVQGAPAAKGVKLSEALRMAYLNNPALNSGRADLLATQESLPQAQAGWKPLITADADVTNNDTSGGGGSDSNDTSKGVGLTLNQPVYRGGRTIAQSGSARYLIKARAEILRSQEQDVFERATTAYMDVLRDSALLDLRRQNQDLLSRQLKATRDRFEVGELTKTDVSQSEARYAGAEADVIDATGNLNATRAVFMQIIGLAPDGLAPPDIILTLPETLEEAVAQAEENSPLVLAAENLHLSSEKDIDTVFGELLPQVGFFTSVDKAYDPPGGISGDRTNRAIGLEASIPLYEAGAVRSRVRQAKHAANSRYLDIMDAKRQAREAAVRNWEDLMAARAQIDSREAQVKAARIAQEGVKQEAEFGARSVLDALDADQELLDAEVALVVARRDEVVARFALMAALGKLTPETLGFGNDAINLDGNLNAIQRKIFDMDVDRVGHSG